MPTEVTEIDGKYYAVINSLTNSTYALVWNPVEFSDVSDNWAEDTINNMGSRMVITGVGGGNYEPERNITRAEFAAIVVRGLGLAPETGASGFDDVDPDEWYCGYIETASSYGIINGYGDGTFGPKDMITREHAMLMIARAMNITGLEADLTSSEISDLLDSYADGAEVSDDSAAGIAACLETGVVNGRSGNMIAPKDFITRAEVAAIVERLLQKSGLI